MVGVRAFIAGLVTAFAVLVGALLAAPGQAVGPPDITVKVAKSKNGEYRQEARLKPPSGPENFFFRMKSDGGQGQSLIFQSDANSNEYKARWYLGDKNISAEVRGLGYEFKLKPGKVKLFELVTVPDDGGIACLFGQGVNNEAHVHDTAYVIFRAQGMTPLC